VNLWLDDTRDPAVTAAAHGHHGEWTWAKDLQEAKRHLESGSVDRVSLDYDLKGEEKGAHLIPWMRRTGNWPKRGISLHSHNPEGLNEMSGALALAAPFQPTGMYRWGDWQAPKKPKESKREAKESNKSSKSK